jgi:hypothetical protein
MASNPLGSGSTGSDSDAVPNGPICPEHWAVISEWSAYEVSDCGRVRRRESGRIRKLTPTSCGGRYRAIGLTQHGRRKTLLVHRLVAIAFLGSPTSELPFVNHRDGNSTNNHVNNLEWSNRSRNATHAYRVLGRTPSGAKLERAEVAEIRRSHPAGESLVELAESYGVTTGTVSDIVNRRTWKFVH